jgi:hypothetical protein
MQTLLIAIVTASGTVAIATVAAHAWAHWTIRKLDRAQSESEGSD